MSFHVDIKTGPHNFVKENLATKSDRKSTYDEMICTDCGIKGKRRGFQFVEVDGRYSQQKAENCIGKVKPSKQIKITQCNASGPQFKNLKPGSVHKTVNPPEGYSHDKKGVWVMGIGEPVKVLKGEFEDYTEQNINS